jgi:UPF0755 protein
VLVAGCMIAAGLWLLFAYYQLFHASILDNHQKPVPFKVYPGFSIEKLAESLQANHWLKQPKLFIFYAKEKGYARHLQFGEYWVRPNMSLIDLLKNIVKGEDRVRHDITFIEGWTFQDMMQALAKNHDIKHLCAGKTNLEIMAFLKDGKKNPEGLFFPATYYFTWLDPDVRILKKSYARMQVFLNKAWPKRAAHLPYESSYQALIVASMIEKETAESKEKPLIAGVILRRLEKGMRLQIDPTVLYGLNKPYGTLIKKSDLRSKTLYNTYYIQGLPPTPIAMPSGSSIEAALHPDATKYLFYVAKGNGKHQFSETYSEHLQAIKVFGAARERVTSSAIQNLQALLGYQLNYCPLQFSRVSVTDAR